VLDSSALYDAVATQDTMTMVRSAIRARLAVIDAVLGLELRAALKRDDDDASGGKPACDWDDAPAREALVDGLGSSASSRTRRDANMGDDAPACAAGSASNTTSPCWPPQSNLARLAVLGVRLPAAPSD
jgi:hypothetical protein